MKLKNLFDTIISTFLLACASVGVEGARILIAIYEKRKKMKELEEKGC